MSIKLTVTHQQGFTLLEIVLVLFLLGLMASSTLFLTEGIEDQAKYDETKHRIEMIRTAIIGDTSRTINGRPAIGGFASDMGRLPLCLRELLTLLGCDDTVDTDDLPAWEQDTDSLVWAGWRGPYLSGNTELSGDIHFRDGYGNSGGTTGSPTDDWQNSGWNLDFTSTVGAITIISQGFSVTDTSDDVSIENLVTNADYQVTLGSDWQNVDITLTNQQNSHIIIAQDELRLRLNTPLDGVVLSYGDDEFDTAAERNTSTQLSRTFPSENRLLLSAAGTMEINATETLTFVPDAKITTGSPNNIALTSGTVITYTDSSPQSSKFIVGSNCAPDCTLSFPNSATFTTNSGTTNLSPPVTDEDVGTLTFSNTSTLTLNNHYIAPTTLTATNLALPSIEIDGSSTLSSNTVTLPLGATITLSSTIATKIDTTLVLEDAEITVSEPFTLTSGNEVVTNSSADTFTVPTGTTLGTTTNSLTIPATTIVTGGAKSFSVLCESNGTPYDGDCSTIGSNTPISMTLIPRNTLPINTSPLEWVIQ